MGGKKKGFALFACFGGGRRRKGSPTDSEEDFQPHAPPALPPDQTEVIAQPFIPAETTTEVEETVPFTEEESVQETPAEAEGNAGEEPADATSPSFIPNEWISVGKNHEQLHIEENSTGHSYDSVLGWCLDRRVTVVEVDDPYIRSVHQCYNFLRLCELCVAKCPNLRQIMLLTGLDPGDEMEQRSRLNQIGASLFERGIELVITFSNTLHDREIRINNNWIVKIGRGLSYFQPPTNKFCLGVNDLDMRPCRETTVDVMRTA